MRARNEAYNHKFEVGAVMRATRAGLDAAFFDLARGENCILCKEHDSFLFFDWNYGSVTPFSGDE